MQVLILISVFSCPFGCFWQSPPWRHPLRRRFSSFCSNLRKNAKKRLTEPESGVTMQSKLNRLIEARYPSVPPGRPVQPGKGKGPPPKCPGNACCPGAGSAENICRTVTRFFVKRYHWLFGEARWGPVFRIFHEPLGKAVHFFHHSQPAGKTIRRTRRRQS